MKPKRPLPSKPAPIDVASKKIAKFISTPRTRICDSSLQELFESFSDGTPAWLTGSSVWLPAVYNEEPDRDGDMDVIFATQAAAARFLKNVVAELDRRAPAGQRFVITNNSFGSGRILHPDGKPVFDIWACTDDQTIHEALLQYPADRPEIRCAYLLSRSPTGACLVRMLPQKEKTAGGIFDGIRNMPVAKSGGYPGRY